MLGEVLSVAVVDMSPMAVMVQIGLGGFGLEQGVQASRWSDGCMLPVRVMADG